MSVEENVSIAARGILIASLNSTRLTWMLRPAY